MTAEAEVRELIERRAAAARAKDVDAALEPFASDVATFDVINPLHHHGTNSVRHRTQQWFATFDGPIGYDIRDLTVQASDDIAFAHYLYRVSGRLTTGNELGMWNRATFCCKRLGGAWRIVHEHDS